MHHFFQENTAPGAEILVFLKPDPRLELNIEEIFRIVVKNTRDNIVIAFTIFHGKKRGK